jgi:cellulose synthase/poly-beta-1,6-N-acetylglucosamine synthase-like glycosyltransferase
MSHPISDRAFVTVILPVRNEERHLEGCLLSVLGQDYPPELMEILVADGRSEDGTRDLIARHAQADGRVRLVDNAGRIVPTGLNAAIQESRGEVIVRVDGHTRIEPDYVSRSVEALRRTGADVVGGNMRAVGRSTFGRSVALATSTPMGVGGSRFHYAAREEPAESVYMGVFRRDLFARYGLFDEGMVRNQDDELNYRIRARGGRIVLVPGLRSTYAPRESTAALFRQYFQYGFYKVRVASLHPRMFRPRHALPSLFVLAIAGLAVAAAWAPVARTLFPLLLLLHFGASLAFSARAAAGETAAWLLSPFATLILHMGYGSGFLIGAASALLGRPPGASERREQGDPR